MRFLTVSPLHDAHSVLSPPPPPHSLFTPDFFTLSSDLDIDVSLSMCLYFNFFVFIFI